jgi:tRNA A37 methylthiotransferase MiaB
VRLREAQRLASERARAKRVGQTVRVLVEDRRTLRRTDPMAVALAGAEVSVGRSQGEAPGVDGAVYFRADRPIGSFVDVRLDGCGSFDFHGTVVPAAVPA